MKKTIKKQWISWLCGRARRTFFVYGLRRSGNHACIRWLANALEGQAVSLAIIAFTDNFKISNTGRTVFIDQINDLDSSQYRQAIRVHRQQIRAAEFVILSAEDQSASYAKSCRIPHGAEMICVRRRALNLIASRFQKLNEQAHKGKADLGQTLRRRFFATLEQNMNRPGGTPWNFEDWYSDERWRAGFLEQLGLAVDIAPPVAAEGHGSSFTGTSITPSVDDLNNRFRMVYPERAWRDFLRYVAAEQPGCFTAEEHRLIEAFLG